MIRRSVIVLLWLSSVALGQHLGAIGDWPDWRGPDRDGRSLEKGLPETWSLGGLNLAWRVPYGGRSTPVVLGNHLYLQSAGEPGTGQERVRCLNADSGKLIWEYVFNVFQSDVPPHRLGWASPAADPETGNVYVLGVNDLLTALTQSGKKLWERSLTEEFSPFTTHGGRTVSPIVDGDLVIVNTITSSWGAQGNRAQRFIALDKRTGEIAWVSTPGGRPFDTSYSPMNIVTLDGMRTLVTGGADGAALAIKPQTGEPVWNMQFAKRGLNTGIVVNKVYGFVSHSEENEDSNEMGLIAAFDIQGKGKLGKESVKWADQGFRGGFSSPVLDTNGERLYQADDGSNLYAFDTNTGRQLWKQNLGALQKASAVFADGKIYIGSESGKFYILKPHEDHCEVLSEVELPLSDQGLASQKIPEPVIASVAVARGRIYLVSSDELYAIGPKRTRAKSWRPVRQVPELGEGEAAWVQVVPTEMVLKPGDAVQLHARLYDAAGRFLREETSAEWSLHGLMGTVVSGKLLVASDNVGQAGTVQVAVGNLKGESRARVIPPLPWNQTFDSYPVGSVPPYWVSATAGRFQVSEIEGRKVLEKLPNETLFKRIRVFMGSEDWSNYTVEASIRITGKHHQLGDAGIIAQRYTLVAFGNSQRLEMNSWQPEVKRTVSSSFTWKPDTWYRLKLSVENEPDGTTRIRGKAWLANETEPDAWLIDHTDPNPNRKGSPGLFADAQFGVYFDNLKVTPNQ